MDLEQLKALIAKGESDTLEFKQTTNTRSLQEAGQTLCGFLNNRGGYVLFGITDQGKIVGQEVADKTERGVNENILKHFEPHAPIYVETIDIGANKTVIILEANTALAEPPYYFSKIPYFRLRKATMIMPPTMVEELLLSRKMAHKRWESLPAIGVTLKDLDHEEITKTILKGISHNRIPSDADPNDIEDALRRLELISDQINNAAVVLYAKEPSLQYNQCLLRLARFRGNDKREFIDNLQVHGNAFKILRATEDFCDRHLPIASRFVSGKMERIDEPFLPPLAIREAVINAICHRDYTIHGSAINLAIYDDRLEIESYGKLSRNIVVEHFKKKHKSYPTNPIIAGVFFRRGMIEQWGRGTQQIVELCLEGGHPEPEYVVDSGGVTVILYSKNPMQTRRDIILENKKDDLTTREKNIILALTSNDFGLSITDLRSKLEGSVNKKTILRNLRSLEEKGLVIRKGKGKNTLWFNRVDPTK